MNRLMRFIMIAAFTIVISCSSSNDTQSQLNKIDDLKSKGFPITAEQQESIDKFITEGKNLIKEGKEKEASDALAKAIDILNMALDADIFNKAD